MARADRAAAARRARPAHRLRRSGATAATLYEGARLLVQPSFEEGFGIPVLEAMTRRRAGRRRQSRRAAGSARRRRAAGRSRRSRRASPPPSRGCSTTTRSRRRARSKGVARARQFRLGRARRDGVYDAYRATPIEHAPMRIGIDARELCGRATGVGRYLGGLLARMGGRRRARAGTSSCSTRRSRSALPLDARRFADARRRRRAGHLVGAGAAAARVAARITSTSSSRRRTRRRFASRVPTVVAIHDVSFVAHPEWFRLREGAPPPVADAAGGAARRARSSRSRSSRGASSSSGSASPTRASTSFRPASPRPSVPATPTAAGRRVLYVGSIFNRRHVPDLIRAFAPSRARIRRGRSTSSATTAASPPENPGDAIARAGLDGRVRWRRYVPDDELRPDVSGGARVRVSVGVRRARADAARGARGRRAARAARHAGGARELRRRRALLRPGRSGGRGERAGAVAVRRAPRARLLAAAPGALAKYTWPRAARDTLAVLERSGG